MPPEFARFELANLTPAECYDLLTAVVVPRPIAMISTLSGSGQANLAPFSFFMIGGVNPPSLIFSASASKTGLEKDSLRYVRETGEFTVNLVTRDMAPAMFATGSDTPNAADDWALTGLTPMASERIKPARIAESPLQMECKLFDVIHHGYGSGAARYVIGEVLLMHAADLCTTGGKLDPKRVLPLARLGGSDYLDLADGAILNLERPTTPAGTSLRG